MRLSNPLLARAGVLALAWLILAPATAGADVYAWRTDDGVFAYTDDPKKIPARYADEAVAVRDTELAAYPRLTQEDSAAAREVTERMQQRLEYLRRVNGLDTRTARPSPTTVRSNERTTVSVATGNDRLPILDVSTASGDEPIVVEPILSRSSDESVTRRTTLVKQGDRTLAVVKGRSHHYNVNEDIYDEEELEEGR